jgi:hypothetical protein
MIESLVCAAGVAGVDDLHGRGAVYRTHPADCRRLTLPSAFLRRDQIITEVAVAKADEGREQAGDDVAPRTLLSLLLRRSNSPARNFSVTCGTWRMLGEMRQEMSWAASTVRPVALQASAEGREVGEALGPPSSGSGSRAAWRTSAASRRARLGNVDLDQSAGIQKENQRRSSLTISEASLPRFGKAGALEPAFRPPGQGHQTAGLELGQALLLGPLLELR